MRRQSQLPHHHRDHNLLHRRCCHHHNWHRLRLCHQQLLRQRLPQRIHPLHWRSLRATSSPFNLTYVPQSVVVTPANTFVYIATNSLTTTGDIYGYSVGTGGALSILNSGTPARSRNAAALEVSADGKYLFSLNTDGLTIEQYTLNTSTGVLSLRGQLSHLRRHHGRRRRAPPASSSLPAETSWSPPSAPGGAETFAYNTTTGALTAASVVSPSSASVGVYGATIDANNYLYLAFTTAFRSSPPPPQAFTLPSSPTPSATARIRSSSTPPAPTSTSPTSLTAPSPASRSEPAAPSRPWPARPSTAPTNVIALGITSNGSDLLASGYNTSTGPPALLHRFRRHHYPSPPAPPPAPPQPTPSP